MLPRMMMTIRLSAPRDSNPVCVSIGDHTILAGLNPMVNAMLMLMLFMLALRATLPQTDANLFCFR